MPSEVLRDTCWYLRRQDLEAFLLADKAHSHFVDSNFRQIGPLRTISFAALTADISASDRGFCAKSNGEEKNASSIEEICCHLKNSFVQRFRLNCAALNVAASETLKGFKDTYVIDSLDIELCTLSPGDISQIRLALNGVFDCRTVLCHFHFHPSAEEESLLSQELMTTFLTSNTVADTNALTLWDMPPCDSSLIADWLHGATSGVPRRLYIWCICCGFDALMLAELLRKKFANDTCPRRYEFQIGGEYVGTAEEVPNEYLENSHDEALEIKTIHTCYCELSFKRLRKEDFL